MLQLNITQGNNEDILLQAELIEKKQLRMICVVIICGVTTCNSQHSDVNCKQKNYLEK